MEDIRIWCENTMTVREVPMGTLLKEICTDETALAALVDNKLKSLDYKVMNPHNVRFIGYEHPDGRRTYIRSLCFVLQNVIRQMYPDKILAIDYALPSGLYCELREKKPSEDGRPRRIFLTDEESCVYVYGEEAYVSEALLEKMGVSVLVVGETSVIH